MCHRYYAGGVRSQGRLGGRKSGSIGVTCRAASEAGHDVLPAIHWQDAQARHRLYQPNQRTPLGRPLFPRVAGWQEVLAECLRTYERRIRGEPEGVDCGNEAGDRGGERAKGVWCAFISGVGKVEGQAKTQKTAEDIIQAVFAYMSKILIWQFLQDLITRSFTVSSTCI